MSGVELFGEGIGVAEATGWGAIAISVVSAVSAMFMAWNGRKKDKDKFDHEAKLKELELHTNQCLEDRDEQRKHLEQVQTKLDKCEEKHEESLRNHEDSQSQIGELRKMVEELIQRQ